MIVAVAEPLAIGAPAYAQNSGPPTHLAQLSAERTFDIAAQPLTTALTLFGQQSGLQVTVHGTLPRDMSAPAVRGTMTNAEALTRLLAGSGLTYVVTDETTVAIERPVAGLEGGPSQLGTITVEGELDVDPADVPFMTPGSSAYISLEQIERIQPSSPGDIFKEVPGVLSGASNDGTSINVNIRSAQGLNRVRTMVEGTQQESSGYQGYFGADQRTYIDPDLIGGVEVSKGPGGGPYGTGTTAGTVNVRLLDADDLVPEGDSFGVRLRGGLAGNGKTPQFLDRLIRRGADAGLRERDRNDFLTDDNWFGSIAGAYRSDRFELVGAFAKRKEGNYFAGRNGPETFVAFQDTSQGPEPREFRFSPIEPGQEVPNTSEDTSSFLLKGALRFQDGHSLEAGYNRYDSEFGQAFPSSLLLYPPQQFALNEVKSNRYWLRYKWESQNDLIDLQANVWHTNAEETGEVRQAPQENESWGVEVWNTSFLDTGLGSLTLTYGGEYAKSEAVVDAETSVSGRQWEQGPGGDFEVRDALSPAFDGSREVFGGYINAVFEPTDWLALNAGLRYDRFKAESRSAGFQCELDFTEFDRAVATGNAAVAEAERPLDEYSDRILADFDAGRITLDRLLFLLTQGPEYLALRQAFIDATNAANAARQTAINGFDGFCGRRALDSEFGEARFSPRVGVTVEPLEGLQLFGQYSEGFRALSLVELGQTFDGPVTVNPDLKPEVVKTWEAGINYFDNGVFFQDDAVRTKLVYFKNHYDTFITRTGFFDSSFSNSAFFYENVPDVTISGYEASLSYDAGQVFADLNVSIFDEPLDLPAQASIQQPKYTGTFTLGTRWFDERLTLGSRLTFFGKPYVDGDLDASQYYYYWTDQRIVDLFGSYQVNDRLALGFSVENVMDRYYVAPLYVSSIPAPGRTFRIYFTARF